MEKVTIQGSTGSQEGQEWLFIFLDEKDKQFKDIRITCSGCEKRHSIYIPCPQKELEWT